VKIKIDGIEANVLAEDQYLQINDISGSDLGRIWPQIEANYAAYDRWLVYHNAADIPIDLLSEIGATLEDDFIEMRLYADSFNCPKTLNATRITEENFATFAAYHDKQSPDMYWTSERIARDLSRWGIFALLQDGQIADYILLSMWHPDEAEIFCVTEGSSCEELITFAAKYAFENGKKYVLYMADDNSISHKAALSVRFAATGFSKSYKIKRSDT